MKRILIFIFITAFITSIFLYVSKPKLHKPFEISIIEYIIKFNNDGSATYTKEVTTTKLKELK